MTHAVEEGLARYRPRGVGGFAVAAAYAATYALCDLAMRPLAAAPSHVVPWYPAAGIGIAALLFGGFEGAALLLVVRFALIYLAPPSTPPSLGAALVDSIGSVAAYAVGAAIIRRYIPLIDHAWRVRDAVVLMLAIALAAIAGALWSAAAAVLRGLPAPAWDEVRLFAAGDAIGGFIVLPVILFIAHPDRRRARARALAAADDVYVGSPDERPRKSSRTSGRRWAERAAQTLAIVIAIAVTWMRHSANLPIAGYEWIVCFLPMFWIAEREGLRGAAAAVAVYGIAWMGIAAAPGGSIDELATAQSLLLALGVCGLVVGATRTATEESASRYWSLVATASEGIWRLDRDGRTLYANPRMAEILGLPGEDLVGRPAADFIAPEDVAAWRDRRAERARGLTATYEARLMRADGSRAIVIATASPVRSAATGEIVGSVAVATDVTAMRQLESREREAQELLEAAFRTARDAMILFRAGDERIVDVNDVWCAVTGYSRDEVVGKSQRDLGLWSDPTDADRMTQAIREHGAVIDFEVAFNRHLANGRTELGYALLSAQPVRAGDETYFLVVGRDVTAARRADEAQSHMRRLEELGRLAGAVAHDFNNLLTVVLAYAQMIRLNANGDRARLAADVTEIERACFRAADVTKRLLAFSRRRPIEPRPVALSGLVDAARGMLATIAGRSVQVITELEPALPSIVADAGQVDQVLLNLAVNARDAMPDGGELRVTTRSVRAAPGEVRELIGPDVLPGDYVELRVEDTGVGMDSETQRRAFEPFFTTKPQGEGTGIGLAVVAGIARQARGAVRVRSAPGRGTAVSVFWPAAAAAAPYVVEQLAAGSGADAGGGGRIRVVVAEDDDTVRELVSRVLESAGFAVRTARDGGDALACVSELTEGGTPPDVVLADLVMPGMGGYELAARLAERYPTVRVVLMTGHAQWRTPGTVPPNVAGEPLSKPFDSDTLRRVITEALDRGAETTGR